MPLTNLAIAVVVSAVLSSLNSDACPNAPVNITTSLKPGWKHTIMSPGFPVNYPNNVTCLWRISGPRGYSLLLILDHFEIEPSQDCDSDYLLTASSEWEAKWRNRGQCSVLSDGYIKSLTQTQLLSNRKLTYTGYDVMWLKFRSDATSAFKGFKGEVRLVAPTANGNCESHLHGSSGSFTSPKYPSQYPPTVSCTWHITVSEGLKAKLTFTDFSLENTKTSQGDCSNDFVEIREGAWGRYGKILGRFCGDVIPSTVTSPSNQMWVRFSSDGNSSTVYKGFNAQFSGSIIMLYHPMVVWLPVFTFLSACFFS